MRKKCTVCSQPFETNNPRDYICSYECGQIKAEKLAEARRLKKENPKNFSLEQCPYASGAIKSSNWYYDELKPCEV